MVKLHASNSDQQLAARQDVTRSGSEIVPVVIRQAGGKAVESYLCYFARTGKKASASVYRAAARQFFAWCKESGLALNSLAGGHVVSFFDTKRQEWKESTKALYFGALKHLFAHLEADRIIERSPLAGLSLPRQTGQDSPPPTVAGLKEFLQAVDGIGEESQLFRPGLVAMYPIVIGGMDTKEMAKFTGIELAEVESYAGRLRENGIWTSDGKIVVDCEDDVSERMVNMVLMIGCAAGIFQRFRLEEGKDQPRENADT